MNVRIAAKGRESMPVEDNHLTTFREYLAALPEPDPTRLREKLAKVVAADFDGTDLPEPLRKQGWEGLALFRERANQVGATITVEEIFATGDKVVARMIGTLTPAGASEPFRFSSSRSLRSKPTVQTQARSVGAGWSSTGRKCSSSWG